MANKTLNNLFTALVKELGKQLEEGRKVLDKEGNIIAVSPDAATMNVIRQLLKDNGVEADPDENPELKKLRDSLPFNDFAADDTNSSHLN